MKFIAVFYVINNTRRTGYGGVDYSTPRPAVFLHIWIIPYTQSSSYGGTKYTYGYDDTGFVTSIGYGGTAENASVTPLLQYSYYGDAYGASGAIDSNQLYSKTYANGDTEEYMYSKVSGGNKTQVEHVNENGSTIGTYIYNYNTNGAMTSQSYIINGATKVIYDYGELDNLEEQTLKINGLDFTFQYTKNYDTLNNRIESAQIYSVITCLETDYKRLNYTYNAEGQVSGISYDSYDVEYTYDKMGRLTNSLAPMRSGYQNVQNENYVYKTYGNGYTTNLLTFIDDQTNEDNDRTATYDENGYVTGVGYNGKTYAYTYDSVGRLTSETKNGVVVGEYEYDENNNIKKITSGGTVKEYSYDSLNRLSDDDYVYDAMGNPIVYKGNTFTWEQGRKLVSGTLNGNSFTYSYDGNGMRFEKTVNGVKTEYYYNGSQLLMESKNGQRTWYIYGVTGIEGMIVESGWQDSIYYFDKNTLGDIVAIRDESGNIVATYEYDAWGNYTVCDEWGYMNTSSSFIGNINPFRYRGYYYDNETGFYYLQTRYYDPTICRFINADNYELVAQLSYVPGQLNMYAYCGNNPIMYTDPTGQAWWHWVVGGAAVLVAGIAVVATAGGAAAGIGAVAAVLAGGSAATVGATVAASVFIGASTTYIAMGIAAGISSIGSSSFSDSFADYGETAMWSTIGAGILSGIGGYFSHVTYGTHTPKTLYPFGQYYNVNAKTMTHYGLNGQMSWSKHFTNHGNSATHLYVPHYHAELPHYPNSGFESKTQLIKELIARIFGRGH